MITKKALKKALTELEKAFLEFKMNTQIKVKELEEKLGSRDAVLEELLKKEEEAKDIITGPEAAKLLGWQSGYVSSTWLEKVGVKYSKGDNGCLKISRKDIEDYLTTRTKTTED